MNHGAKKILRISLIILFFVIILGYGYYRSKDLIFGVKIRNVSFGGAPAQSGATVTEPVLAITGNAKNAVLLTLDDREISIDQAGDFTESLALQPGYNIITIRAKDTFGHLDEKDYQLIYKPQ